MMKRIDTVKRNYRRRIASTLPLREGVSVARVLRQTFAAVEQFWDDYEDTGSRYSIDLRLELQALLLAPRRHSRAGKPNKVALRSFVKALIAIYEDATGERIGRIINPYVDQKQEKPHPFLAICIEAASFGKIKEDDTTYPSRIIQEVLEELHVRQVSG
jgi:hypothetical protein